METDHSGRFVLLFFVGLGLLLAGAANLSLRRARTTHRLLATLLAGGIALLGCRVCAGERHLPWLTGAAIAVGVVPGLALGCGRITRSVAGLIRRPAVHWGAIGTVGLAALAGSAAVYQAEDDTALDRGMEQLEQLTAGKASGSDPRSLWVSAGGMDVPLRDAEVRAVTDRGTVVPLRVASMPRGPDALAVMEEKLFRSTPCRDQLIRRRPPDDVSNCHGWVFTGGRFWLSSEGVDLILAENGYAVVTDPRPGDLGVYRDPGQGPAAHSSVVRYVAPGMPVLVEGKWGCGPVYLHPFDQSVFGPTCVYYRSERSGHMLIGLGGPASPSVHPPTPEAATE